MINFSILVDFKTNQEIKLQKKSGNGRLMFHGGHLKIDKESMHSAKCSFSSNYFQHLIAESPPETQKKNLDRYLEWYQLVAMCSTWCFHSRLL